MGQCSSAVHSARLSLLIGRSLSQMFAGLSIFSAAGGRVIKSGQNPDPISVATPDPTTRPGTSQPLSVGFGGGASLFFEDLGEMALVREAAL